MRICIVADQIYKIGGIERVLSCRTQHWNDQGHDVHLITHENKNKKPYYPYSDHIIHHDLKSNLNKEKSLFSLINLFFAFFYFFRLLKVYINVKPDVCIVVGYGYDYYFIPLIARKSYLIKEYHSSIQIKKSLSKMDKVQMYFAKLYDHHIFLSSEEAKNSTVDTLQASVIANPLPVEIDLNHCQSLSQRKKVILAAGRIVPLKGFDRLIQAWGEIAAKYPEWQLEIYGDGEQDYVLQLQEKIESLKIGTNSVIYASTPNILEKMATGRIYAMTSHTECFPLVLLEAMFCQMAIIAFDCPTGPRNILQDNYTGVLVNNDDISLFARKLEQLLVSEEYSQTLASQAYSSSEIYKFEHIMNQWDQVLNKVKFK